MGLTGTQKRLAKKLFSGKYVKSEDLVHFREKVVKFRHFVKFSCIYFGTKMFCPLLIKLTELLRLCTCCYGWMNSQIEQCSALNRLQYL